MRYAGMLTTTRVSVGIAFGPGNISGLGSAAAGLAFAVAGLAVGDAVGDGVDTAVVCLLGSTVQPRNTDKSKINNRLRIFMFAGSATGVPLNKSVFPGRFCTINEQTGSIEDTD